VSNSLSELNWIDIFGLIVLIRISYVAIRQGIVVELFKLLGCISAVFFASHYYTVLSEAFPSAVKFPQVLAEVFSFITLILIGYFLVFLLRAVFFRFFKIEASALIDKWGAALIGIIRGLLVVSLILLFFLLTNVRYLRRSINSSFAGVRVSRIAPRVYAGVWENLVSKFYSGRDINSAVFELLERRGN